MPEMILHNKPARPYASRYSPSNACSRRPTAAAPPPPPTASSPDRPPAPSTRGRPHRSGGRGSCRDCARRGLGGPDCPPRAAFAASARTGRRRTSVQRERGGRGRSLRLLPRILRRPWQILRRPRHAHTALSSRATTPSDRLQHLLALAGQLVDPGRAPPPALATIARSSAGELEHQAGVLEPLRAHVAGSPGAGDEVGDDPRELLVVGRQIRQRRGRPPGEVPGRTAVAARS